MKDNIDIANIFNRNIIIELRFASYPKFFDMKGSLISKLEEKNIFKDTTWRLREDTIQISDANNIEEVQNTIIFSVNRFSFISSKINSIDSFYKKLINVYEIFKNEYSNVIIKRIGCRIQGTYKTKTQNYSKILDNFKKGFPSDLLFESITPNDLRIIVGYSNGTYQIGPVNKDDIFYMENFQRNSYSNNEIGFGIDTDNYWINEDNIKNIDIKKIQDVLNASLSIEKTIYERIKEF